MTSALRSQRCLWAFHLMVLSIGLMGQSLHYQVQELTDSHPPTHNATSVTSAKRATTTIYSENFSNGVPAGWNTYGYSSTGTPMPACIWEYRGTSTTPNNTVGSRGAFSTSSNGFNQPLNSTTRSNGFMIFDSDYLDNGGVSANQGQGPAPTGHVGILRSDTIDLSGQFNLRLVFEHSARVYQANLVVEYSVDGGLTWPYSDTIASHNTLGINGFISNATVASRDISSTIAGASNAMIRFVFDGTPGNTINHGYYYWMIDDIRIEVIPQHELQITSVNNRPAIFVEAGNPAQPLKSIYGHQSVDEARPIAFSGIIENTGASYQTNVQLKVDVVNSAGVVVHTCSSIAIDTLFQGATASRAQTITSTWTPSIIDEYQLKYYLSSDSLTTSSNDSLPFSFSNYITSLDFSHKDNSIGSNELGDTGQIAVRMEFLQDEYIHSVQVGIDGNNTDVGGILEVSIYDTAGFNLSSGFPTYPIATASHTITQADINNEMAEISMATPATGSSAYCDMSVTGAYYVVVKLNTLNGTKDIAIWNDQQVIQPLLASIMYFTKSNPSWYFGFTTPELNAPHIRVKSSNQCYLNIDMGTIERACGPYSAPSGTTYTQSGTGFLDTVPSTSGSGCIMVYHFDLDLEAEGSIAVEICNGKSFTLPSGNGTLQTAGTYTDTIVGGAAAGCDSIVNITLTTVNVNMAVTRQPNSTILQVGETSASYQWIKCDNPNAGIINGATGRLFYVPANGSYAVIVTKGGCKDTSNCFSVQDIGLNDLHSPTAVVYPNPAQSVLHVQRSNWNRVIRVELCDLSGKVHTTVENPNEDLSLPVSQLQNGMYILRVISADNSSTSVKISILR